ncbi:3'-5' exonuclease [Vibrio coralliilyticus]|uniref:3'-5' exonuclease n=1 Tax=Vibrio coralliilyticus TaxID=190893 RepID=UPI0017D27AA0|nr:3'-5' exonuclease [Vibrio coralliilyticus]NUW69013.1 UvrD-helicase domain-containing protein [Vibrio coralliilyticus]
MKTLQSVTPTPEQMKLMVLPRPGTKIVRGAAGSGKTTTSILMMKLSIGWLIDHFTQSSNDNAINIRVFTFNKTLSAYISDLVTDETVLPSNIRHKLNIQVTTLSKYMYQMLGQKPTIWNANEQAYQIIQLGLAASIPLESQFLADEVEYLLGRLSDGDLESYIDMERTGRGTKPRVDKQLRREVLDKVVYPYIERKHASNALDWNDLALVFANEKFEDIHIAIIDEAQDFSANQLKAIANQLADVNFTTIVLDSNQKIYKRGFTWREAGVDTRDTTYARLELNYRNTIEIAQFASRLIENSSIAIDDDGTLPKLEAITRNGDKPIVVEARFREQMNYILRYLRENVDLENENVGFLHAKGGGWFDEIRSRLNQASFDFVEIATESHWPPAKTNIALSTIHSAKGLEFDHVFIIGLEDQHFSFRSPDNEDADYSTAIKLLSMAITRAKQNVVIGYNPISKPSFLEHLDADTYELVRL